MTGVQTCALPISVANATPAILTSAAAGIASLVNVFEPEVVVVGGGFGIAGELLLAQAREVVVIEGLEPARDTVRIVEAELGAEAGVIGAGMVAFEALGPVA